MLTERPILFSAPMVKAILTGQKQQTRRIVKPMKGEQSAWLTLEGINNSPRLTIAMLTKERNGRDALGAQMEYPKGGPLGWVPCPYGQPGDRLWVRESLWVSECGKYYARPTCGPSGADYDVLAADGSAQWSWWTRNTIDRRAPERTVLSWGNQGRRTRSGRWIAAFDMRFADMDTTINVVPGTGNAIRTSYEAMFRKQKPAIFMPRWASRITLEVTGIRVERVQDISEEDARAEGVGGSEGPHGASRALFSRLWDSINGERASWASNPWVWVVEFRRVV